MPSPQLAEAARELALQGFAVFPCGHDKRPCLREWPKIATSDPDPAFQLFQRCRNAELIGVATGDASGITVVDFDPPEGVRYFQDYLTRFPETRLHRTRRGGIHALYQSPAVEIRNSAGKIARNVDVRGWHGFVIFPPSPGYTVLHEADIAPFPAWLIKRLTRKPKVSTAANPTPQSGNLNGLTRFVSRLGPGTRNCGLFWAAARAGEKIAAGAIDHGQAYAHLASAVNGWTDPDKTLKTLENGLMRGRTEARA